MPSVILRAPRQTQPLRLPVRELWGERLLHQTPMSNCAAPAPGERHPSICKSSDHRTHPFDVALRETRRRHPFDLLVEETLAASVVDSRRQVHHKKGHRLAASSDVHWPRNLSGNPAPQRLPKTFHVWCPSGTDPQKRWKQRPSKCSISSPFGEFGLTPLYQQRQKIHSTRQKHFHMPKLFQTRTIPNKFYSSKGWIKASPFETETVNIEMSPRHTFLSLPRCP